VRKAPKDFPEPLNRKLRKLEKLEIAPPPAPKPPTKEEIKALKKRDHQLLNLLKVQIQPIMDQINRKYRKFRTPVIPQSQIQYLYDEMDPDFVRPDIPQFRPFELDTDKDGVRGLRETSSGKFFYNLETTTIEERLSNGFYARPKDYLADIRSLAKDAKHIGDKDRTLRANELLANVEVDIATIEAQPAFADCENVYARQMQRAKEKEEKIKKRTADLGFGSVVRSNILTSELNSDLQSSGPLTLGETIPGTRPISLATLNSSGLSNGISADPDHSKSLNGTSVRSREDGNDVHMSGTDDHVQLADQSSLRMQPPNQQWPAMPRGASNPSNHATGGNTQISQRSAFQEISHGTSPSALINDASTTTSGKKTSEEWSTQAANGVSGQSTSPIEKSGHDSQLPDTQRNPDSQQGTTQGDTSSDDPWPHSQAHGLARGNIIQTYPSQTPSSGGSSSQNPAVPRFDASPRHHLTVKKPSKMVNILNDSPVEPTSQASSQKDIIIDEVFLQDLLTRLTEGSSGCSIEQLEQINRELMAALWDMRGEYNRNRVAAKLVDVFNETITDIEDMQRVLQASQPSQLQSS
jgi:ATPase family AAA domain-containing protein 2